jgi:hypothetical protein
MLVLAVRLQQVLRKVSGAAASLNLLLTLTVVRAASSHHVEHWFPSAMMPLELGLEVAGIALVALSAWQDG